MRLAFASMGNDHLSLKPIYSVGHSSLTEIAFFALLGRHAITTLIDTRSQASSRFASHFDAGLLAQSCDVAGVRYVAMGKELGGRPGSPDFYDPSGRVIYAKLAVWPTFVRGLERLIRLSQSQRIALMCAEEDPHGCHRRLLIGFELGRRGFDVLHIRADGRVQTEADLRTTETAAVQRQLFGEDSGWKSTRSVSRAGRPRISSGS
jgi:uncharacterized protein (DUF488 family)